MKPCRFPSRLVRRINIVIVSCPLPLLNLRPLHYNAVTHSREHRRPIDGHGQGNITDVVRFVVSDVPLGPTATYQQRVNDPHNEGLRRQDASIMARNASKFR